jgi:TusA-related sulfurtransferase
VSDRPPDPPGAGSEAAAVELDIRNEVCPYTFLAAKLALEPLAPGRILRVVVGNETSARDVPRSLADAGHAILGVEPAGPGLWRITVRKGSDRRRPV